MRMPTARINVLINDIFPLVRVDVFCDWICYQVVSLLISCYVGLMSTVSFYGTEVFVTRSKNFINGDDYVSSAACRLSINQAKITLPEFRKG